MQQAWQARQTAMERWYTAQASDPDRVVDALAFEYLPFAGFLSALRGSVLDVGGGAGLASAHLHRDTCYVVLDPSTLWVTRTWQDIRARLAPDGPEPCFVVGVAERMPFAEASFDAALAFWSLNHVADPLNCILQLHRVLRLGGRALIVLEDMEPSWADAARLAVRSVTGALGRPVGCTIGWHQAGIATAGETIRHKLSGKPWPLQSDHVRISGRDLHGWLRGRFRTVRRSWPAEFLTYELVRI